ncbi:MAG: TIR domain-containing protein [Clostridia bacterium]|nr:TIR domain-containing protein [Clostridia bacterium]
MEQNETCVICGKTLESNKCTNCDRLGVLAKDNVALALAYTALNNKNFITAQTLFREYIVSHENDAEGYFGLACAKYGLRYDTVVNGKNTLTPTYYLETDIFSDADFLKALKLANDETKVEYRDAFNLAHNILGVWKSKMSKEPKYDIFISYKETDEAKGVERTQDSIEAQDLYIYLSSLGYKVFYARESLRGKSKLEHEAYIYNALRTSKVMIAYGQSVEYFESSQMKDEWSRFKDMIALKQKENNSLLVAYEKVNVEDLNKIFGDVEFVDAHKKSFLVDIRDAVGLRIAKAKEDLVARDMHLKSITMDSFTRKLNHVLNYILYGCIMLGGVCAITWLFMYNFTGIHKIASNVLDIVLLVSIVICITLSTILAFKDPGKNQKYISCIVLGVAGLAFAIFGLCGANYRADKSYEYGEFLYRGYDFSYEKGADGVTDSVTIYGIDKILDGLMWDVTIPKQILGHDVEKVYIRNNNSVKTLNIDTTICKEIVVIKCDSLSKINVMVNRVVNSLSVSYCKSLSTIDFGSVQKVNNLSISHCDKLNRIAIENATYVKMAVDNCKELEYIVIPNTSSIHFDIEKCNKLKTIDLSGVKRIENMYFTDCASLEVIDFVTATYITNLKFINCPSFTKIHFRSQVDIPSSMNFERISADYIMIVESQAVLNNIKGTVPFDVNSVLGMGYPTKLYVKNGLDPNVLTWLNASYTEVSQETISSVEYRVFNYTGATA